MADNYLHFPDVALNLVNHTTTADSVALSITDLLDVQARVLPDNWLIGSDDQTFAAKYHVVANMRSWWFRTAVGGSILSMSLSVNGSAFNVYSSTVSVGSARNLADILWVRVRVDCAAGFIYFYTSTDGGALVWSQLGDPVAVTEASIFDSTAPLEIGCRESTTSSEFGGNMYRVRIMDDTTPVFDADFSNLTPADLEAGAFTEAYGNTVTLVGDSWAYVRPVPSSLPLLSEAKILLEAADGNKGHSAKWADRSGGNHHAENGTGPAADTNDALFKNYEAVDGQYIYLPGTADNRVITPNVNLLDADSAHLEQSIGLWTGHGAALSNDYAAVFGNNILKATAVSQWFGTAAESHPVDADTEYTVSLSYLDPVGRAGGGADSIHVYLQWFDAGGGSLGTSESASTDPALPAGEWVHLSNTATTPALTVSAKITIKLEGDWSGRVSYLDAVCLQLGATATFVPSFNIVGDLDVSARWAAVEWNTGTIQIVLDRYNATPGGYRLSVTGAGDIGAAFRTNLGSSTITTDQYPLVDGDANYARYTVDVSAGDLTWYDEFGGVVDTGTFAAGTSLDSESISAFVGATDTNSAYLEGDIYFIEVRDGIDGPVVLSFDPSVAAEPYATFTDPDTGNVWTIGRSATGLVSAIIDRAKWLFTTDDSMEVAHHADIDFDDTDDFTVLWYGRAWPNNASGNRLLSKRGTEGYVMLVGNPDGTAGQLFLDGATTGVTASGLAGIDELTDAVIVGLREAGVGLNVYTDGVKGNDFADSTGTTATTSPLHIGYSGSTLYYEGELFAVAIWDRLLTDAEIVQAGAELTRLPATELGRHGDALLAYLKDNYTIESSEVISALNEFNGITAVGRSEYKRARDTAFGL